MLVLTRKVGERIHIGADIVVTVTDIHHGKVRLGIEAPRSVPVFREELCSQPQSEAPLAKAMNLA